ncbi:MAG: M23 family metallopeptidase [Bacteroidota bacterium]
MALLEKLFFLSRMALSENWLLIIGTHLVVPLSLIAWLFIFRSKTKFNWCLKILVIGSYLALFYLVGRWSVISVYFRYLMVVLFLLAAGFSYFWVKDESFWDSKNWFEWVMTISFGLTGAVFAFLLVVAVSGRIHPGGPIELSFPLKTGAYYIINGGSSIVVNNYRANTYFNRKRLAAAVQYGVDIEKLNRMGMAARGFLPQDYKSYAIFGETVYSPCAGQVIEVVDVLPDFNPPDKDWLNITGNRVVIKSFEQTLITLSHLQQHSIIVKPGDWVEPGQPIATVGNSGLSIRPHLTVQATQKSIWGQGVPMVFDGQFPVRNQIIIKR